MLALAPLICKTYVPALIIFGDTIGRQIRFSAFATSLSFVLVALALRAPGTAGSVGLQLVGRPRLTALRQWHQMIQDLLVDSESLATASSISLGFDVRIFPRVV